MSKELTEKWKNDKLSDWYYCEREVLFKGNTSIHPVFLSKMNETEYRSLIVEVLDKVPDYDEYKQMEEQINNLQKMLEYECSKRCELEAQLAEANEIIKFYANTDRMTEEEKQMTAEKYHLVYGLKANDYLKKYGVEK